MKIEREGEVKKVYIFYLGIDSIHRHTSKGIVVWGRTLRLRAQAEGGRTKSPVQTTVASEKDGFMSETMI